MTWHRQQWSLAAALLTMVAWGMNFAFVKYVLEHIGVWPFMFIRFVTLPVLAFALLFVVFRGRIARTWPRREDLARFVACGLIGHTAHIAMVMYGMNLSTAFSSSLVLTSGPLFTLLILAALGAERLRRRQLAGTLVAFCGIVVFLGDKFTRGLAAAGFGDLLLLGAAFLFSLYTVLSRPLADRYGPLIVLAYTLLFGSPPLVALSLSSFLASPEGALTAPVTFALFFTIVISSFFGWLAWSWVNSVRGLARCAPFQYLMPPIAGLVAWLTLGEVFTPLKLAGAAVTMAGVAWAQYAAQPDSA
ncbi:MAG TPA: DMT family transporter [Burkholderiales bacterium]|jgi:drug/metabolite transporter (DMT)-like permease|nr:DMT family transporter [Burkholderiales bacterium]